MSLKYACLLLCPEEHIDTANAACVEITGLESAKNTFSIHNYVVDDGGAKYAIAGASIPQAVYDAMQPVRDELGGFSAVLKTHDGEQWNDVISHTEWLENHGFERPISEDESA